jgi:hypothetical protein
MNSLFPLELFAFLGSLGYFAKLMFDCLKPSNFAFRIETIEKITYELSRNSVSNVLEANIKDTTKKTEYKFGIKSTKVDNKEIFYNGLINVGLTSIVYFASYLDFLGEILLN